MRKVSNLSSHHFIQEAELVPVEVEKPVELDRFPFVQREGWIECTPPERDAQGKLIGGQSIVDQGEHYLIRGFANQTFRLLKTSVTSIERDLSGNRKIILQPTALQEGKLQGLLASFERCDPTRCYPDGSLVKETVPLYQKDLTTNDLYLNETTETLKSKHITLALFTPLQWVGIVINTLVLTLKIFSFYSLWAPQLRGGEHSTTLFCPSLKERFSLYYHDIIRLVSAPISLLFLTFAPLYGIHHPQTGRKMVATWERFFYHQSFMAPCFQPHKPGYSRIPLCKGVFGDNHCSFLISNNN